MLITVKQSGLRTTGTTSRGQRDHHETNDCFKKGYRQKEWERCELVVVENGPLLAVLLRQLQVLGQVHVQGLGGLVRGKWV